MNPVLPLFLLFAYLVSTACFVPLVTATMRARKES